MARADQDFDAVVVGAGWAGLGVSNALQLAGLSHIVFERNRPCETWRTQRWDSFRMNTPNVQTVMPGARYCGPDPEGFMTRDDFVEMVVDYSQRRALPVETSTPVTSVRRVDSKGFEVVTPGGTTRASNVVIAASNLNIPKRPHLSANLPDTVTQMDGSGYRRAELLKPGAVLVIGCGNSGGQIAEDLAESGRKVFLSTGNNGRIPRRYRGGDISLWLHLTGRYNMPRTAKTGRPLLGATHTISLQSLSAKGIVMLCRFSGVDGGGAVSFADDLQENARFGDQISAEIKREIDDFIERKGLSVPLASIEEAESVSAQFPDPPILRLDPLAHGITTVIWCVGFGGDFSWVHVPGAIDSRGLPVQQGCMSVLGVYFCRPRHLGSIQGRHHPRGRRGVQPDRRSHRCAQRRVRHLSVRFGVDHGRKRSSGSWPFTPRSDFGDLGATDFVSTVNPDRQRLR